MKVLTRMVFALVTGAAITAAAGAAEGVAGSTVRPATDKAKVAGCVIAKPGDYRATVGDLIELDYTFPLTSATLPKKVDFKQTLIGAVGKSPLGFRNATVPNVVSTGTIAFYFEAKKEGEETITLTIDGEEYVYNFKVNRLIIK